MITPDPAGQKSHLFNEANWHMGIGITAEPEVSQSHVTCNPTGGLCKALQLSSGVCSRREDEDCRRAR